MKKNLLAAVAQALLYALAAFVLFCLVAIFVFQRAVGYFQAYYGAGEGLVLFYGFLVLAGLLALWVLFELMLVMQTVSADPFVERNVGAFLRMGIAAEAAGALFLAKCFVFFTPMTAVCGIVMLLSGLFALVLAGVFRKAVEYKCENELTI
ncbi:MAG TPA: hypothetical protein VN540_08455 [Clostridia bacterium]|nr:hypothetical protein [Clostridia bacterium]